MRNQLLMAEQAGIRAATINSANHDDWPAIEAQVRARTLDLLLISPERLNNVRFRPAQQVSNVIDAFEVATPVPAGTVLLVDDTVDSRWTLSTIGVTLRQAGSGPVHPFVLARAGGG